MAINHNLDQGALEKIASPEALYAKHVEIMSGPQVLHPSGDAFLAAAVRIEQLLARVAELEAPAPAAVAPELDAEPKRSHRKGDG